MSAIQPSLSKTKRLVVNSSKLTTMSKPKNILLIDDDEIFIFLTSKLLQSISEVGNISVSYSAMEAINYLEMIDQKGFPDIILLDLNMPGLSGWDFLEFYSILHPKFKKQPLLYVVSSSIAANDTERALKLRGVSGYIAKPINTDSLKKIFQAA